MPITENGYEYTMPTNIEAMIDRDFCLQFRNELYQIYNLSLCDFANDTVVYYEGSAGWNTAFALACIKTNKEDLYQYYRGLPWYESDMFDGDVQELMIKYSTILGKSIDEIIAEQLKMELSDFCNCSHCGKRFLIANLNKIDEPEARSKDVMSLYICNQCKRDKENTDNPGYNRNINDYYLEGLRLIDKKFKISKQAENQNR